MVAIQEQTAATPESSAEGPAPRRGFLRRTGSAALGLALCAGAVGAQQLVLSQEESGANLTHNAAIGETVQTSRYSFKLSSFAAARAVDTPKRLGRSEDPVIKVQTKHVFLIAETSATAAKEPMQFNAQGIAIVTPDGKRYQPTDKIDQDLTLPSRWVQPGFWISGPVVFEVPEKAIPGARFVISPVEGVIVDSYAPEVDVDLGLDEAAAAKLLSGIEPYHPLVTAK